MEDSTLSTKKTIIQQIIAQKARIIAWWTYGYIAIGIGVLLTTLFPSFGLLWYELGGKFGTLAVLTLAVTLTPGIMRRLLIQGPLMKFQVLLMVFRRQLGISMYLFALAHYLLVKVIPTISLQLQPTFAPFEIAGLLAFMLTTPLFLTSNTWSVNRLGPIWKKIHGLVYGIALLILIHLVLLGGLRPITLVALTVVIFEAYSWAVVWYRRSRPTGPVIT